MESFPEKKDKMSQYILYPHKNINKMIQIDLLFVNLKKYFEIKFK